MLAWSTRLPSRDGTIRAAESSFNGIKTVYGTPTATGDVVIYPKYMVLVAENSSWSRLTAAQQDAIRKAALAARGCVLCPNHTPDTPDAAGSGVRQAEASVEAGPANVATFRAAAQPVIDRLESNTPGPNGDRRHRADWRKYSGH